MEKEKKCPLKDGKKLLNTTDNPIYTRFGHGVHLARLERRISQDHLATLARVSRSYISDVERGKRNVSLEVVGRLAIALEIDVAKLFM